MRYRINWTESVGYYTYIEASSKDEALEMFNDGNFISIQPDGYCEQQDDAEVTEDPEE